jgi:hypothetical protein
MVRPRDFGFNEETGLDNEFQTRPEEPAAEINSRANREFQAMVDRLRAEGVEVLVLEPDPSDPRKLPDAVFPNNWFSTEPDGTIITYPMKTPNRRAERRLGDLEALLRRGGRVVGPAVAMGESGQSDQFLEGTGSLVIDHAARVVYAARSERTDAALVDDFVRRRSYREGILFDTRSSTGRPIYHTNVVMSLGDHFAVVCGEAIPDARQRSRVEESLGRSCELIEISRGQMERHFCGNILQLRNRDGAPLVVMSVRAERGFAPEQRRRLAGFGKIVSVELETIERVGGGSARCMLAEVFSPHTSPQRERGMETA